MCNLYSVTKTQSAIRQLAKAMVDDAGNHMLFSLLTTEANTEVGAVHEKAMPVCLLTEPDRELWMRGEVEDVLTLQRTAQDGTLKVVATGAKQDGA